MVMVDQVAKISLIVVLVCTLLFTGSGDLQAESSQPDIRIGVVPSTEALSVGSNSSFVIMDKITGEILLNGNNQDVDVSLDSVSEIQTHYRLQVAYTTNDTYVADWLDRASIAGYPTYVQPYLNGYRLFIGEFPENASWSVRAAFKNEVITKGLAATDAFWKQVTLVLGESKIKVTSGEEVQISSNPITIESSDGLVTIEGKTYRGIGEIAINSGGTLSGINEIPLEEYLYGVVPRELPPVPYGEIEAQKAQAIAARTYALNNLGKRSSDGYDLLPTPSDQVYGGYEAEHPVSTQAVQETTGVVATYDGELITAVYNSTSGGYSANNEDVWSSAPVPYLRGVPDAEKGKSLEHVPTLEVFKNHSNPNSLRASKEGDYESDWSKYHRWTFEWTAEEISNVMGSYFNTDVGQVLEINVIKRSNSGRILEIEFVTENGTFYEYKDKVRWALKYINSNGGQSVLLSTLFYIEPVIDPKTKAVSGFQVYGGGWGHGVGLSQTGAVGMATKGYTYEQILKHYYQGIELEKRY
jgi:stage II sporulation protein D